MQTTFHSEIGSGSIWIAHKTGPHVSESLEKQGSGLGNTLANIIQLSKQCRYSYIQNSVQ